jgi:coenzyme F420-0:L-glutamate ligase/coenzyme F420-1:gamma-L-glutamate ligase
MTGVQLLPLPGWPDVQPGDDLATLVLESIARLGLALQAGDVLVLAQKVVSKSEGRLVALASVQPSARALELAPQVRKDARLVELVLRESRRIVRTAPDVLIVEDRHGFIMANAGIDQSNVQGNAAGEFALLLPDDPDASAQRLRGALGERTGVSPGVLVNDSFGRPWRLGTVGVAIGCAGVAATLDLRGEHDRYGRELKVTVVGHADEIAAAASLVMGQAAEGTPCVLVRGLAAQGAPQPASALLRTSGEDLFR